ncbi:3-ketoacyl- reductase, partial [Pseudomonas coronafaciens pv. garcae]
MPSDRYIDFANSDMGRRLVNATGLPAPAHLERWQAGRLRPVEGTLLISAGPLGDQVRQFASRLTDSLYSFGSEMPGASTWVANQGPRLKAVVFDASQILRTDQLKQLRDFFQPLLRNLDHCAHVVILARSPATLEDPLAASTQQAIEGFS